ncbi:MAG: helix-turn-helix domain-containing protein [Clostridia bacterium]|nr:helix-turn-helix domain-containing protein [Clostridia bacterium]
MTDIYESFALRLRGRRQELGLTQRRLAEQLGYSEKAISKWESGAAIAPSVILPKLATALRTDVNYLLLGADGAKYLLGIDGGGTKTDFMLTDTEGNEIARVKLDGCNPVDVGYRFMCDVLSEGITRVCGSIPCSDISVFAGIAGGTAGSNREYIHDYLKGFGFYSVKNGNDAESAVAAALDTDNGTVVIIGTGSIAFSQIDGVLYRRGGFGNLFEDGGSGYHIGRDAILTALKDEEMGRTGRILELVREQLGRESVLSSLSELYAGGKRRIAEFSRVVFTAYDDGDAVAEQILKGNMKAIAELIESAPITSTDGGRNRIYLMGGLISRADVLLPMIKASLGDPDSYEIFTNTTPPVMGAIRLAARSLKEK